MAMELRLKKLYFALLIPAIAGFVIVGTAKILLKLNLYLAREFPILGPGLFVLAIASGVAFPILWRTLFANKNRNRKHITEMELMRFERGCLYIALAAPYFALIGFLLDIPRFHFYGTILASLYAVYYFYPSEKRIKFERRIFRVR